MRDSISDTLLYPTEAPVRFPEQCSRKAQGNGGGLFCRYLLGLGTFTTFEGSGFGSFVIEGAGGLGKLVSFAGLGFGSFVI